ncbi:MAG: nucleoside-diphosphate kinase [Firmicutes bacterium]|nr:nucleoside-diphosphate kinase [Bacillota bacterium]
MEKTLVLVKPDAVERGLCGEILRRFERQGLRLAGLKLLHLTRKQAVEHYAEHRDRPFFPELLDHITSGPLVAAIITGKDAIARVRRLIGATAEAVPGTIRGDFATSVTANVVHGSDSPESAARELALFFPLETTLGAD